MSFYLPSPFELGVVACLGLFFRGYRLGSEVALLLLWVLLVLGAFGNEDPEMLALRQLLVISVCMLCMYTKLDFLIERRVQGRGGGVLTRVVLFLSMLAFVGLFLKYCLEHESALRSMSVETGAENILVTFLAMLLFPLGWLGAMTLALRLDEMQDCRA